MVVTLKGQQFSILSFRGDEVVKRSCPSDRELAQLTTVAWGRPGKLLGRWLSLADMMVVAMHAAVCSGFIMAKLLRPDVLLYSAAVVHPAARHVGLLTFMSMYLVRLAWSARTRIDGWKVWRIPRALYLVFRTANPVVYSSVAHRLRLMPAPGGRPPRPDEAEIGTLVARAYGVEQGFDRDTFVIRGALLPYPELVYRPERIPWSSDRAVDEYFRSTLDLEHMKGNELVAIGKAHKTASLLYVTAKSLFA